MENKKSINNMEYVLAGDYYIPDLKLPNEERPIGKYGQMHREHLKEHNPMRFKEYLINRDGNLEVLKKYPTNGKTTIWIYANHPSNDGFNDLLLKKNNELKAMIRAAHLEDGVNLSINSAMRAALWASLGDTNCFLCRRCNQSLSRAKATAIHAHIVGCKGYI